MVFIPPAQIASVWRLTKSSELTAPISNWVTPTIAKRGHRRNENALRCNISNVRLVGLISVLECRHCQSVPSRALATERSCAPVPPNGSAAMSQSNAILASLSESDVAALRSSQSHPSATKDSSVRSWRDDQSRLLSHKCGRLTRCIVGDRRNDRGRNGRQGWRGWYCVCVGWKSRTEPCHRPIERRCNGL
jgi:hypothetical protein